MKRGWFPALTALIGIVVGAALTFLREQIAIRHKDNRDNEVWHCDRRAEIVDKAVMFGSAIYPPIHPDHEKWKANMAKAHRAKGGQTWPNSTKAKSLANSGNGR